MIFYFSGTGNSLWIATELSKALNENIISIPEELNNFDNNFEYALENVDGKERIIFVFPVHSWGPAVLVTEFIKKIKIINYTGQEVYCVCTCGDNCGFTSKKIDKVLRNKGVYLTKSYSIQMPNNYILMAGFGLDPEEVEKNKLNNATELISSVVEDIKSHGNLELYTLGTSPFIKSNIVYPLFKNFALGRNKFYATDSCISCKLCEKVCPTKTIKMVDEKPKWGNNCVQCTACIHRCPVRAIEYGKITINQGRYINPILR